MRRLLMLWIAFLITFNMLGTTTFALTVENYVYSKAYSASSANVAVSGTMPMVKNLPNTVFQQKLNSSIQELYEKKTAEAAAKKIRSLKFEYNVVLSGNFLSIAIYCINTRTSASEAASFVIDISKCRYVTMSTILGANALAYANKVFDAKIKAQKTTRYFNLTEIKNTNAFFINNSNVYLIFGAGEICAVSKGITTFEIPSSGISNITIPATACYTKSLYNVKMVPLRSALAQFGYSLSFDASTGTINIIKGTFSTNIKVGKNSYYKGKQSPRQLEFAPEIRNGITYVPISFFNDILDMLFSVDPLGNVTLSKYSL